MLGAEIKIKCKLMTECKIWCSQIEDKVRDRYQKSLMETDVADTKNGCGNE